MKQDMVVEEIKQKITADAEQQKLEEMRDKNHQDYFALDIRFAKKAVKIYEKEAQEIIDLYNKINSMNLLTDTRELIIKNANLIAKISDKIEKLKVVAAEYLNKMIEENDLEEDKIKLDMVEDNAEEKKGLRKKFYEKYSNLKLFNNSSDKSNILFEIERQEQRKKYIDEIKDILDRYENNITDKEKEERLSKINLEIKKIRDQYLSDINDLRKIDSNSSKHRIEFKQFLRWCEELLDYNDNDYNACKEELLILKSDKVFKDKIKYFTKIFTKENKIREEKEFVARHIDKSSMITLLKSITNDYNHLLKPREQENMNDLLVNATNTEDEDFNIFAYKNKIAPILNKIWTESLTDPIKFQNGDKFSFLCCTGGFNDNIIKSFLLTDKIVGSKNFKGDTYGYICMGNSNIITITEKTNYKKDDVIKYKTPKQVENETANYKINSLIVLNPDNTIIDGMYYIYDEATGTSKQKKAQMLAQKNELQLITIDISNYQTNK